MFIKTVKLKSLISGLAIAGLVLGAISIGGVSKAVRTAASKRQLPIYCVERNDKKVAISFDAAWGNEDTETLIKILGEHKVKTTFFVVGSWVDKYPESVKALADAGHEIMNHSNTHPHMTSLDAEGIIAEANACSDKIEKITGKRPNLLRVPYGDYNDMVISTLKQEGIYTIQWDVDSLDWKDLSAAQITERVLTGVKEGSIVLFHNAAKHTPEALSGILSAFQEKGFEIVPVSELIYYDNYAIDHTGKQIKNPEATNEEKTE